MIELFEVLINIIDMQQAMLRKLTRLLAMHMDPEELASYKAELGKIDDCISR